MPVDTPWGYTLRHWALENGIYWLETDECAEGLTICSPIWQAELGQNNLAAMFLEEFGVKIEQKCL